MSESQALNGLVGRLPTTFDQPTAPGAIDKNGFLRLLLAQMRHQDPLNPMDSQEYSASLAQFTQLEELQNLNTLTNQGLQADIILSQSINNTLAATLVGKSVKAIGESVVIKDGVPRDLSFDLATAGRVEIAILDESGEVVRTVKSKSLNAGEHTIDWDGKDDDGRALADGTYTIQMRGYDASGADVRVTPYVIGRVEAVRYEATGAILVVDGLRIGFGDVLELRDAGEASGSNGGQGVVASFISKLGF